jgi:nitrite reductase/ring-hydroxylating ferredoxin subunit
MSPVTQVFPNARSLPVNRREMLAVFWLATLLVSLIAFAAVVAIYASPRPQIFTLGKVQDFQHGKPKLVSIGSRQFWVVSMPDRLYVFDSVTPHFTAWRYLWVPSTSRFEDPLTGSKFTIDGRYIEGPAVSGLTGYQPVILPDGTIQVSDWDKIPAAPLEDDCSWRYMSCGSESGCQEVCVKAAGKP